MDKLRKCRTCSDLKELSEYTSGRKNKYQCKTCINENARKRWELNKEKSNAKRRIRKKELPEIQKLMAKENSKKYYASTAGRAKTLLKGINDRTQGNHEITVEWLIEQLQKEFCPMTGIKFDMYAHPVYKKNPYAPSVDRIDSSKGYTTDNTRIVIWQYNMAKAETTDSELLDFCKKVVEKSNG